MGTGVAVRAAQHPSVEDAEGSSCLDVGGAPQGVWRLPGWFLPVVRRFMPGTLVMPGLNRVKGLRVFQARSFFSFAGGNYSFM